MTSQNSQQEPRAVVSSSSSSTPLGGDIIDMERLDSYMEKIRFLEALNRELGLQLDEQMNKRGNETNAIKAMFEAELQKVRRQLKDTMVEKSELEIRVQALQDQRTEDLRQLGDAKKWREEDSQRINKLNQQLAGQEFEVAMLSRTNENLETEGQRDKAINTGLKEQLDALRKDYQDEVTERRQAQDHAKSLTEEMEFLKSIHNQELKELAALHYTNTTANEELSRAIFERQSEYDCKLDQNLGRY